jgi:hypothetical protein
LRKHYAPRSLAQTTVSESRRAWLDTPLSLCAIQCGCLFSCFFPSFRQEEHRTDAPGLILAFQALEEPSGMQALVAHSVQTYVRLPSDLHPRRCVRRSPSPYPQTRVSNGNFNSNVNANASFGDFDNSNSSSTSSFNTSNASLSQRQQHATSNKPMTPPSFVHSDPYASRNTTRTLVIPPSRR